MQKFEIKFRKLIEGKYFGSFKSIFKGSGIEINDFRKYIPGDSFKTINRKLFAKHNELFVNKFHSDKELEMDIFLDINYNRKGGNHEIIYKKFMQYFADIIVYARKNMINLKIYYPEIEKSEITIRLLKIDRNLEIAYNFLQNFPNLIKNIQKRYYSQCSYFLETAKKSKKRRAIIVFSDFLDITDNDKKIIKILKKEHALYLAKILINTNYGQNYDKFFIKSKNIKNTIGKDIFEIN